MNVHLQNNINQNYNDVFKLNKQLINAMEKLDTPEKIENEKNKLITQTLAIEIEIKQGKINYFKVLGISPEQAEISGSIINAYRVKALQVHPDKMEGNYTGNQLLRETMLRTCGFVLVQEAKDALSDKNKRIQLKELFYTEQYRQPQRFTITPPQGFAYAQPQGSNNAQPQERPNGHPQNCPNPQQESTYTARPKKRKFVDPQPSSVYTIPAYITDPNLNDTRNFELEKQRMSTLSLEVKKEEALKYLTAENKVDAKILEFICQNFEKGRAVFYDDIKIHCLEKLGLNFSKPKIYMRFLFSIYSCLSRTAEHKGKAQVTPTELGIEVNKRLTTKESQNSEKIFTDPAQTNKTNNCNKDKNIHNNPMQSAAPQQPGSSKPGFFQEKPEEFTRSQQSAAEDSKNQQQDPYKPQHRGQPDTQSDLTERERENLEKQRRAAIEYLSKNPMDASILEFVCSNTEKGVPATFPSIRSYCNIVLKKENFLPLRDLVFLCNTYKCLKRLSTTGNPGPVRVLPADIGIEANQWMRNNKQKDEQNRDNVASF